MNKNSYHDNATHNDHSRHIDITVSSASELKSILRDFMRDEAEEIECEESVPTSTPSATRAATPAATPAVPAELNTPQAQQLWKRCKEQEWVDDNLQPTLSQKKAAILASVMSDILGLSPRWASFEKLWNIPELANKLTQSQNCKYYNDYLSKFEKLQEYK